MKEDVLYKLHMCELEILNEVKRICDSKGLTFFIAYGSLLGAVRHKGFIPWDDDLDIAMPRQDYQKFIEIAPVELSSSFFLQTSKLDSSYPKPFAKVRKKNTAFVEEVIKDINTPHEIYIDIFELDNVSSSFGINALKAWALENLNFYLSNKRYGRKKKLKREYLLAIFPDSLIISLEDKLMRGKGPFLTNFFAYGIKKETIKVTDYFPVRELEFEGYILPVPNNYMHILKQIYGEDCMQLPPESKRITHTPVRISFDTDGPDEIL